LGDGLTGMQVGPMRGDLQPPGLSGDHGVFVGLRGRQGAGGVQLDQIIIEHPFNIRLKADIDPALQRAAINRQHHTNTDNTAGMLLANASVNALTQQVGVTVVTGVLLDHVDQQLA
jgi:hypothetical protein